MNGSRSSAWWALLVLLVVVVGMAGALGCTCTAPPNGDPNGDPNDPNGDPNDPNTTGGCLGLGTPTDAIHQNGFDELNAYRQANSVAALQYSVTLQQAADDHAKDMYDRNFFDHENPDKESPGDRAVAAGFCHEFGGENILLGVNSLSTASEAVDKWKTSTGHNANMLNGTFKYVGIGYYHVTVGSTDRYYWVQLFASEN